MEQHVHQDLSAIENNHLQALYLDFLNRFIKLRAEQLNYRNLTLDEWFRLVEDYNPVKDEELIDGAKPVIDPYDWYSEPACSAAETVASQQEDFTYDTGELKSEIEKNLNQYYDDIYLEALDQMHFFPPKIRNVPEDKRSRLTLRIFYDDIKWISGELLKLYKQKNQHPFYVPEEPPLSEEEIQEAFALLEWFENDDNFKKQ